MVLLPPSAYFFFMSTWFVNCLLGSWCWADWCLNIYCIYLYLWFGYILTVNNQHINQLKRYCLQVSLQHLGSLAPLGVGLDTGQSSLCQANATKTRLRLACLALEDFDASPALLSSLRTSPPQALAGLSLPPPPGSQGVTSIVLKGSFGYLESGFGYHPSQGHQDQGVGSNAGEVHITVWVLRVAFSFLWPLQRV